MGVYTEKINSSTYRVVRDGIVFYVTGIPHHVLVFKEDGHNATLCGVEMGRGSCTLGVLDVLLSLIVADNINIEDMLNLREELNAVEKGLYDKLASVVQDVYDNVVIPYLNRCAESSSAISGGKLCG